MPNKKFALMAALLDESNLLLLTLLLLLLLLLMALKAFLRPILLNFFLQNWRDGIIKQYFYAYFGEFLNKVCNFRVVDILL